MRNKFVLVPFPFDDLSALKVRPAVCLTDEIAPYGHVVLAFITSKVPSAPGATDLVIQANDPDFQANGLKVASTIRLHRLMTVSKKIIRRDLGELSARQRAKIDPMLSVLFGI